MTTIKQATEQYLSSVAGARAASTARVYGIAMRAFLEVLESHDIDPDQVDVSELTERPFSWLLEAVKSKGISTERIYVNGVLGFYSFLVADDLANVNMERLRMLRKQRSRRQGARIVKFPEAVIERIITYAEQDKPQTTARTLPGYHVELRQWRDRAMVLTLADTGLRIHELCNLRVSDIDFDREKAVIVGKGDKEAVVRFSGRAIEALLEYLSARHELDRLYIRFDPKAGPGDLPVFVRHDKGAGTTAKIMTTRGASVAIGELAGRAVGAEATGISPHSFRHYFITRTIKKTNGNLVLARNLARHENIQTTMRYTHFAESEMDQAYQDIFG